MTTNWQSLANKGTKFNPALAKIAIEQAQITLWEEGLLVKTIVSITYTEEDNMTMHICMPDRNPLILGLAGFYSLSPDETAATMGTYISSSIKQALTS